MHRPAARAALVALVVSLLTPIWGMPSVRALAEPPSSAARSEQPGWATAQQHIAEREYRASRNAQGLQAPNRAHGLRTYFDPTGIRVHDRTASGSPELLHLALVGVGRGESLAPLEPGRPVLAQEDRVEIRRPGLLEWYVNTPAGLEQGFDLASRPPGEGPLVLELAATGAPARLRGDAVLFETPTGRKLRYGKLEAADAHARPLAARLEVPAPGRVRLVVEDAGAAYPLAIDPLLTEAADTQLESDQASAFFGTLAEAGDVNGDGYADVLVGAPLYDAGETNEGAVFLFLGSATGIADAAPATAAAQLESDQASALLGIGVTGAGDLNGDGYADVLVGAPFYDAGETDEGAAFVFLGSATGIASGSPATAGTQLEADQASASFGWSVAGAGDVNGDGYADVVAGAYLYDAGETDEGATFVFLGSATGIASGSPASAATVLQSDQASSAFGSSVAGAGDVNGDGYADVVAGAYLADAGETDEGAALVFLGSATGIASGSPASAATVLQSDQASSAFGSSVAGAGDLNGDGYADAIVGAPSYDAGETDEGATFVFLGSATGIASGSPASAATVLQSDQASSAFGSSVAGAGDLNGDGYADAIVGAPSYDAGETDEGAAFVFLGSATGIASGSVATAPVELQADQPGAAFGRGVSGAGDVNGDGYADLIASAYLYDAGETDEGAAFVFLGSAGIANGSATTAAAGFEADQANARLGHSVAAAGDVNGDGYADLILGAHSYDAGQTNEGAAFVFLGSASGIASGPLATAAAQLEGDQAGAFFGMSVAGAGDVNGDGYADVIISASGYDAGQVDEGATFVFLGSATGIASGSPATAATELQSDQASSAFGRGVAGAGDVNGDGYADVIVSALSYDAGQENEGAAFVFLGSAAGISDGGPITAAAQLESDQAYATVSSVAGAGDVNGDGYADVLVGSTNYDAGQLDEGAAFVFLGSATGIASGSLTTAAAQLEADQEGALLETVAGAGDVNGDGYADVLVGATNYSAGELGEGAAFVFLGSATGIASGSPASAAAVLEADQANAALGSSVAGAGDVNGDGYADVLVGAQDYQAPELDEGVVLLFLGSPSGIASGSPATAAAQFESDLVNGSLGVSVAGAGDVNGDGYADMLVGAQDYATGEEGEGAAFVFVGNPGGDGRPVLARQTRGDGSGIAVPPWGRSYDTDAFQASLQASHPAGAGRVKLEVEYCPAGVPFGHASCGSQVSASWLAVAPPSALTALTETVAGLAADSPYRWRARVLRAPFRVTESGIAAPPNPAHGPWRRSAAQAEEADLRTGFPPTVCGDGVDNDGDGLSDFPSDPGCTGAADTSEREAGLPCDDDADNDGDGLSDFPSDPGCVNPAGPADPSEREAGLPCDDGVDNDGDTRIDFDPVTFASPGNATTLPSGAGDPGCKSPASAQENPQCQNGLDDADADVTVDYDAGLSANGSADPAGADFNCLGKPWKNSEKKDAQCGLGFESALLLALLRVRSRAKTRRRGAVQR